MKIQVEITIDVGEDAILLIGNDRIGRIGFGDLDEIVEQNYR